MGIKRWSRIDLILHRTRWYWCRWKAEIKGFPTTLISSRTEPYKVDSWPCFDPLPSIRILTPVHGGIPALGDRATAGGLNAGLGQGVSLDVCSDLLLINHLCLLYVGTWVRERRHIAIIVVTFYESATNRSGRPKLTPQCCDGEQHEHRGRACLILLARLARAFAGNGSG